MLRCKEHLPKNDLHKTKSNYACHPMIYNHNYTDFHINLKAIHVCSKGRIMDAPEEFEIYKAFIYRNINNDSILYEQLI